MVAVTPLIISTPTTLTHEGAPAEIASRSTDVERRTSAQPRCAIERTALVLGIFDPMSDLSPRSAAARLGALVKWGAPKAEIEDARRALALANAQQAVVRATQAVKEAKKP